MRAGSLLGHIIRSNDTDPLKMTIISPDSVLPALLLKKRVGKPRSTWWDRTAIFVWEYIKHEMGVDEPFNKDDDTQLLHL